MFVMFTRRKEKFVRLIPIFISGVNRRNKSNGERITLNFRSSHGPIQVENRRSDTIRDDSAKLPKLPKSEPSRRKQKSKITEEKNSHKSSKSGKNKEKPASYSNGSSSKYSHLPVYDKEEERIKAKKREQKISEIFSGEYNLISTLLVDFKFLLSVKLII